MPQITIKAVGAEEVARKLNQYGSQVPRVISDQNRATVESARRILQVYPPGRGGYVRTGKLGRGWNIAKASFLGWRLSNSVKYAVYVVGNSEGSGQAWMHVGRWRTMRKVVDDQQRGAKTQLHKALRDLAKR